MQVSAKNNVDGIFGFFQPVKSAKLRYKPAL